MQRLIIVVAIAACCLAAPWPNKEEHGVSLQRPSPINPEVSSDPKPAETITKITDPKEINEHKREIETNTHGSATPLLPTVQPKHAATEDVQHPPETRSSAIYQHRQKRDSKSPVDEKSTHTDVKAQSTPKVGKISHQQNNTPAPSAAKRTQAVPQSDKPRQKREEPRPANVEPGAPLIHRDEHKTPTNTPHAATSSVSHVAGPLEHQQEKQYRLAPQTPPVHPQPDTFHDILPLDASPTAAQRRKALPALSHALQADTNPEGSVVHVNGKRDIPVPLVAKHPHPEESPSGDEKKEVSQHTTEKHVDDKKSDEKDVIHHDDLSDKVPAHHPQDHHTAQPQQDNTQPQSHNLHEFHPQHAHVEHINAAAVPTASTTSTTELPVIRHHPVPVAELFARPKQHTTN